MPECPQDISMPAGDKTHGVDHIVNAACNTLAGRSNFGPGGTDSHILGRASNCSHLPAQVVWQPRLKCVAGVPLQQLDPEAEKPCYALL